MLPYSSDYITYLITFTIIKYPCISDILYPTLLSYSHTYFLYAMISIVVEPYFNLIKVLATDCPYKRIFQ